MLHVVRGVSFIPCKQREYMYMYVQSDSECVCVCVCVCERERERETFVCLSTKKKREKKSFSPVSSSVWILSITSAAFTLRWREGGREGGRERERERESGSNVKLSIPQGYTILSCPEGEFHYSYPHEYSISQQLVIYKSVDIRSAYHGDRENSLGTELMCC